MEYSILEKSWKVLLFILSLSFILFHVFPLFHETMLQAGDLLVVPQGGVGVYEMEIQPGDSAPWGSIQSELVLFRKVSGRRYTAIIGVDMQWPVREYPLEVRVLRGGETRIIARIPVQVVDGKFGVQRLDLPEQMVDLDKETLARVNREKKTITALWKDGEKKSLWEGTWIMPVEGNLSGSFGNRRVINGKHRNPHNGEDISAARGTAVIAPNTGIVRLTEEHYFGGHTVILDHGAGLFTFYMHLDTINVIPRQLVSKGDILGRAGASGRATGPHLHWGARLNNARINPVWLTKM